MGYLGARSPRSTAAGPRLPELRADRRGGRSRRLLGPHRGLGADLPRLRLDRALGHGGAEEALAAAAVLRRGVRLLRAHRARRRLGPVRRCARGRSSIDGSWRINGQKMWISLGNVRRGRADLRPDQPGEAPPRHRLLPRPHLDRRASPSQEIHGKLGLRASDTASLGLRRRRGPRRRAARGGRRRVQDRDDGARLRPLLGRRRVRRDLRGLRPGLGRLREGAPAVRRPDRELPARPGDDRRHDRAPGRGAACSSGAPGSSRTRASRTPRRRRSPSSTRPSRRSSAPTWRSRSTAAPATSTTTRSSATFATPG